MSVLKLMVVVMQLI